MPRNRQYDLQMEFGERLQQLAVPLWIVAYTDLVSRFWAGECLCIWDEDGQRHAMFLPEPKQK